MRTWFSYRFGRVVGAGAISLLVLAAPQVSGAAQAQYGGCRSDPYIVLSNTAQVDMAADINDSLSDVQSVVYVLHAPVGTSPVAIVATDGLMGIKEKFKFYADDPANTYDTYTTVYTGASHVAVTAESSVTSLPTLGILTQSGYNGQSLHIHL
jgi:hypothetical protein